MTFNPSGITATNWHDYYRDRLVSKRTHGAGATLAAAIAILVAQGNTPRQSVTNARGYLEGAIKNAPDLGSESGPLGHFVN